MTLEKRTTHFRGRVITLTLDEVTLPNGHKSTLEIVHHPGGAAVVAVDAEQRVAMLRQFRHAAGGYIWELPAGKLEPNEPPLSTAQRELIEEAGTRGTHWHSLGECLSSPGVLTELIYLYLATGLEQVAAAPESSEVFELHWLPLQQAFEQTLDGTINDAKTIVGLTRAKHHLERTPKP